MPVQLTLRSPKGGRVLAEREYADGYRIDAVSGWLVVVDRSGSVVAAHAACPGLEGAVVEYASAGVRAAEVGSEPAGEVEYPDGTRTEGVAEDRPNLRSLGVVPVDEDDDGFPPVLANEAREEDDRFAAELMLDLRRLGDTYGPLGVALAAASLTDRRALIAVLLDEGQREPRPEPTEAERVVYREDAEESAARAERAESMLAAQQRTTETLRGHLDAERARAELAENDRDAARERAERLTAERDDLRATLDLYRHRYGSRLEWTGEQLDRPADALPEPVELYVPAEARVSWDGRRLRALYLRPHHGEVGSEAYTDGKGRPLTMRDLREEEGADAVDEPAEPEPEPSTLRPVEEDPRRPHPDSWPDDAVLLRYVELRRLVSLHLERYADARVARAMLEGDVPLRLSEVLDR